MENASTHFFLLKRTDENAEARGAANRKGDGADDGVKLQRVILS
ncbi:MAG: hypothetical protein P8010_25780 [Desulfosarcinaceae bacterium]|jgi:hypothetical protein